MPVLLPADSPRARESMFFAVTSVFLLVKENFYAP